MNKNKIKPGTVCAPAFRFPFVPKTTYIFGDVNQTF